MYSTQALIIGPTWNYRYALCQSHTYIHTYMHFLTLARTWGGMPPPPPPQVGFVLCTPVFEARDLIFCYSCFLILLSSSPKISRVCDLWFVRYDLVHEVMSRPKWPIYIILCWFRVWYTTDVVFCKLHLPCIKQCD